MNPNRRDFIRMGAIAGATALAKGVSAQTGEARSAALPVPDGPEFSGMSGAYAALITPSSASRTALPASTSPAPRARDFSFRWTSARRCTTAP